MLRPVFCSLPSQTVAFHPNGNYLATGSTDLTCRLWDVQSGHCVRVMEGGKVRVTLFLSNAYSAILTTCTFLSPTPLLPFLFCRQLSVVFLSHPMESFLPLGVSSFLCFSDEGWRREGGGSH